MPSIGLGARRFWRALAIATLACTGALSVQATNAQEPQLSMMGGPTIGGEAARIGAQVYQTRCAGCHDNGVNRAPQRVILRNMRPEAIYKSLDTGVMQAMAAGLSDKEKTSVSQYLAEREFGQAGASITDRMCSARHAAFDKSRPPAFTGWGLSPENSHAVPAEVAGLSRADLPRLKLKWAFGFANSNHVRSQPSLAGGAIFIGGQNGYVRALDRETGCVRWRFEASAEVRTTIVVSPWQAGEEEADPLAFFGDLAGNVYAVRAFSGELVWKKHVDAHPAAVITAAPTLHDNRLYVPVSSSEEAAAASPGYVCCSFRGSVLALDAATGGEIWRTYMVGEPQRRQDEEGNVTEAPSGVAVWNTPAIDAERGRLYLATGDNYSDPATELSDAVLALNMMTGSIVWHYQATEGDAWNAACHFKVANCPEDEGPDFDFGAGVILHHSADGRDILLAGQKSGIAYGIDAQSGKPVWQRRLGKGGITGGILFGIAASDGRLYVPVSDIQADPADPYPKSPGLYGLDAASGELLWEWKAGTCPADRQFCDPGLSGTITATPEFVVAGADDGHLRIHAADSGEVLLDLDLVRPFETVNGIEARGGGMSGNAGPIVEGGQLIVPSGYGHAFKMPGNVLLVYEAD